MSAFLPPRPGGHIAYWNGAKWAAIEAKVPGSGAGMLYAGSHGTSHQQAP